MRIVAWLRTLAIWVLGVLAAWIWGGLIGAALETKLYGSAELLGAIAGVAAFACARLWWDGRRA